MFGFDGGYGYSAVVVREQTLYSSNSVNITGHLLPAYMDHENDIGVYDIGSTEAKWRDAYLDSINVDNAKINGLLDITSGGIIASVDSSKMQLFTTSNKSSMALCLATGQADTANGACEIQVTETSQGVSKIISGNVTTVNGAWISCTFVARPNCKYEIGLLNITNYSLTRVG